jgi:hypothetical protein
VEAKRRLDLFRDPMLTGKRSVPRVPAREVRAFVLALLFLAGIVLGMISCGDEDLIFPGMAAPTPTPRPTATGTPDDDDDNGDDNDGE